MTFVTIYPAVFLFPPEIGKGRSGVFHYNKVSYYLVIKQTTKQARPAVAWFRTT